jgi:hypothetical protein
MNQKKVTMAVFSQRLAAKQMGEVRLLEEATRPFHKHYQKLDAEGQTAYRTEWMLNAFIGALKVSEKRAGEILSQSRTDRTKAQQDVYYRASNSFKYHIIRAEDETVTETPKSHARVAVPKVKVAEAVKLFEGMTREQINALVDRALAQITFE